MHSLAFDNILLFPKKKKTLTSTIPLYCNISASSVRYKCSYAQGIDLPTTSATSNN